MANMQQSSGYSKQYVQHNLDILVDEMKILKLNVHSSADVEYRDGIERHCDRVIRMIRDLSKSL